VVVFDGPVMKLKDQLPVPDQTFVLGAAMGALAVEKTLIPPAAGFDVGHRDERLRSHRATVNRTLVSPVRTTDL
jgi:hypothetical protein